MIVMVLREVSIATTTGVEVRTMPESGFGCWSDGGYQGSYCRMDPPGDRFEEIQESNLHSK